MVETKLIITSDAHGNRERLEKVRCLYDASWIFLDCGDSCLAKQDLNRMGILSVQGNNDVYCSFPEERVLEYGSHRIYMTHGHRVMFFNRYDMLAKKGKEKGCDIAVCGHSHIPHREMIDGVLCLNPGSLFRNRDLSDPSYLSVILTKEEVMIEKHSIK